MKTIKKMSKDQLSLLISLRDCNNLSRKLSLTVAAILMVEAGVSPDTVKMVSGYEYKTLIKLRNKYIKLGFPALEPKVRKRNDKALLNEFQKKELVDLIKVTKPSDHGFNAEFWTTNILGEFIANRYGVKYKSKDPLYLIFQEAKFSFHKPEMVYEKRNEEMIKKWRNSKKNIVKDAKSNPNVVLLCEDEMTLTTQVTTQKVWYEKGKTLKVTEKQVRQRRHFYGFFNCKNNQAVIFKTLKENSEETITILKKIISLYPNKKIVLFWDNASWHKSLLIEKFLEDTNNLELHNFPPYAPEENPQEHIWKAVRANVTHNRFINDIDKISDEVMDFANNRQFEYKFF